MATLRPQKEEEHRARVTIGGEKLDYPGITATDIASINTLKILLKSFISTPLSCFITLDINKYYYNTPMSRYKYMHIPLSLIPDENMDQYDLRQLSKDGWVYMEIWKGMPGLKQAGRIANEDLTKQFQKHGYAPCSCNPALWRHNTLPIVFTLVVDDFGVKYTGKHNADHLINALQALYTINVDQNRYLYCG